MVRQRGTRQNQEARSFAELIEELLIGARLDFLIVIVKLLGYRCALSDATLQNIVI